MPQNSSQVETIDDIRRIGSAIIGLPHEYAWAEGRLGEIIESAAFLWMPHNGIWIPAATWDALARAAVKFWQAHQVWVQEHIVPLVPPKVDDLPDAVQALAESLDVLASMRTALEEDEYEQQRSGTD